MTIEQIRYFVAVTEHQSFSAAADAMHISQSSISKAIIALEAELGVLLFKRGKKVIEHTETGRALYPMAVKLEHGFHEFVRMAGGGARSSIHVISFPFTAQYGLRGTFRAFEEAHPDVRVILEEPTDDDVVRFLQRDLCDFAMVRDTGIYAPEYDGIVVANDELALYTSEENPLAERESVGIADLVDEPLLMMKPGLPLYLIGVRACLEAGFEPKIVGSARIETLLDQAIRREGSALLATTSGSVFRTNGLRRVPIAPAVSCNAVLAWKKMRVLKPYERELITYLDPLWQPANGSVSS